MDNGQNVVRTARRLAPWILVGAVGGVVPVQAVVLEALMPGRGAFLGAGIILVFYCVLAYCLHRVLKTTEVLEGIAGAEVLRRSLVWTVAALGLLLALVQSNAVGLFGEWMSGRF